MVNDGREFIYAVRSVTILVSGYNRSILNIYAAIGDKNFSAWMRSKIDGALAFDTHPFCTLVHYEFLPSKHLSLTQEEWV